MSSEKGKVKRGKNKLITSDDSCAIIGKLGYKTSRARFPESSAREVPRRERWRAANCCVSQVTCDQSDSRSVAQNGANVR